MIINISIVGGKETIAKIRNMSSAIEAALYVKAVTLALMLEKYVKTSKLNGQVLNRITGALARSINNKVDRVSNGVMARVFSAGDVKYAGIHEYGGVTPAHVIIPKKANALAFAMGGKMSFFAKVNHPGSKIPERSYLRSSLRDKSVEISTGFKKTVVETAQKVLK